MEVDNISHQSLFFHLLKVLPLYFKEKGLSSAHQIKPSLC